MFQQNQGQRETKTSQLLSGLSHIWASLKGLYCFFYSCCWWWYFQASVSPCISTLRQTVQGTESIIKLQRAAPAFSISEKSGTELTCVWIVPLQQKNPYGPEAWKIYNKGPWVLKVTTQQKSQPFSPKYHRLSSSSWLEGPRRISARHDWWHVIQTCCPTRIFFLPLAMQENHLCLTYT